MSDTTARDQLAGELLGVLAVASNFPQHAQVRLLGQDMRPLAEKCSDAILAAGWRPPARVVTTVEERDALPRGTVLARIHSDGSGPSCYVNYKDDGWVMATEKIPAPGVSPHDLVGNYLGYLIVLREPEEGE
jgi:hypothetical protein